MRTITAALPAYQIPRWNRVGSAGGLYDKVSRSVGFSRHRRPGRSRPTAAQIVLAGIALLCALAAAAGG